MSKPPTSKRILKDLRQAQRQINEQLASTVAQLKQQSDSIFGNHTTGWSQAGLPDFGDTLITHGNTLVRLGKLFNSGKLPQWVADQERVTVTTGL